MFFNTYWIVAVCWAAYAATVTVAVNKDPCLSGVHRNISHLNERYLKLEDDCPYTDHRIQNTWFYAGPDPIVTFPPTDFCRCGYKFPIWMNGTLPSQEDGEVNRTACLKFVEPCYRKLQIQIKNCGLFFVYHLTPGQDDSGYCFGIEKPEPPRTPGENTENVPNATLTIQQSSITSNSFITAINVTSNKGNCNVSAELVLANGSVLLSVDVPKPSLDYEWENLSSSTNYTVRLYTFTEGEKRVVATSWTITEAAYRPASAKIDVLHSDITNHSFTIILTYDQGSENLTGECNLLLHDGSVIRSFPVEKPSMQKTFQGLTLGTKYIVEVHTYKHGQITYLDQVWVFTQPGVETYLQPVSTKKANLTSTAFRCKFHHSPDIAYKVRWTVQRDERDYTIVKTSDQKHETYGLSLTEEDLIKNHIYLPFHISCAVAENSDKMLQGFSVSSNILFAGIKILTPHVTMRRDETAIIRFTPEVPIGCYSFQNAANDCKLALAITVPVSKNCTGISTRNCNIHISGGKGVEHDLQIQATEDGQYGTLEQATHKVILRTANFKNNTIWNGYVLPAVTIYVKPESETYWRGKRCEALNDPHMYTFDGVRYEHHESFSDEYVLYTHTSYQAKVHHKLERCNSNAMCNCGVAVQAGRDIYVISTCNNTMEIGYKQCDDGVLLVRQETDSMYTVYLPFGTYIKARVDKSPYYNSAGSMIVSVSVFPSVHDQHGRSRGLCGSLDNNRTNDFHDRTGQIKLKRIEFIQNWRISKEDSLFKTSTKSKSPWMHPACTCIVSSGQVLTNDKCHLGADNSCAKGRTVGERTCKLAEKISIESTVPVLHLTKDGNHKDGVTTSKGPSGTNTTLTTKAEAHVSQFITSKTTSSTPTEHWNHDKAKTFCTNYMNSSRAFRLCARVPNTDTERAIETCTQDIVITQTTEWHRLSRQSMQDSCISEIHRNKTVREELEPPRQAISTTTTASGQHIGHDTTLRPNSEVKDSNLNIIELVDAIEEISCPNECSDHGNCRNGTCKCYVGFGGDDCSIDFKKPPSTASLLHGSTCDEKVAQCTHVFIYGGFFASETVTCHIATFETHANKEGRLNMDAYVIRGQAQSLIEVICSLETPIRRQRSVRDTQEVKLMSCYRVSVSNDGIHHGKPLDMCVYNSECQTVSNSSDGLLTAKIKKGYCFIDGFCVPSRKRKPSSDMYCLPETSLYTWSVLPTSTQTSMITSPVEVAYLEHSRSNWQTPVIVAVVCICIICLIVSLVVCIRKQKRRKTNDKKTQKEELKVNYKHDADFDEETYAYINPTDVSDKLTNEKASKWTSGIADDYVRLDTAKKEKTQYAKLNAGNNRGKEDGPVLPERPKDNVRDPYEKIRSIDQKQGDYDKIQGEYRYRHSDTDGKQSDPYTRLSNEARTGNDYFKLEGVPEDYLTPREGNVERNKAPPRNLFIVKKRDEEIPEGYERPDPQLYKQY